MAELALCIAIVAIAMVAIIGVLPLGMNVQKQNREETIINQDAQILMDALKTAAVSGAPLTNIYRDSLKLADRMWTFANQADDLTNFVDYVVVENSLGRSYWRGPWYRPVNGGASADGSRAPLLDGHMFLNALLTPHAETNSGRFVTNMVFAQLRPISGPLSEQPSSLTRKPAPSEAAAEERFDTVFRYIVTAELSPAMPTSPALAQGEEIARLRNLTNQVYDLRLTFEWPVRSQNTDIHQAGQAPNVGANRKTFRTQLAGSLETMFLRNANNRPVVAEIPGPNPARVPLRQFKSSLFVHTPPL